MFEHMLLPTGGTHQGRDAVFAFVGEIGLLAIGTVLMAYYEVLPMHFSQAAVPIYLSLAPPPPPPPQSATRVQVQTPVDKVVPRTFNVPVVTAPASVPQHAAIIADAPAFEDLQGVIGGVPGGAPGGVLGGMPGGSLGALANPFAPPPPPAAKVTKPVEPAPAHAPAPLNVGGDVQAALLIHQVTPVYPSIAKDARIQGTVRLSAIIAPDGTVKDLKVISGSPLLTDSAVNAVRQWVYRPTYLNGVPVEVNTEIIVKFNLQRPIG